jgi:hypothetical protein
MPQAKLIFCVAGASLALLFGLSVFFTARRSPLWVRCSCLFVSVVGTASGYLCFRLEFYRQSLPYRARAYLDHYSTLLGGGAIGALVVLGIYGLVSSYMKRRDKV